MLSENPTSFTITVTSEAGENDESKLNASQRLWGCGISQRKQFCTNNWKQEQIISSMEQWLAWKSVMLILECVCRKSKFKSLFRNKSLDYFGQVAALEGFQWSFPIKWRWWLTKFHVAFILESIDQGTWDSWYQTREMLPEYSEDNFIVFSKSGL